MSTAELPADRRPLLDEILAARRRARLRFRLQFALVWVALIGLLVGALSVTGNIDPGWITDNGDYILAGIWFTVMVSVASICLATLLAAIGALGRISTHPIPSAVAALYVSLVRGTPLIVQLFFIYFALPQFGVVLPAIPSGILALGFNYGAYMTEVFRAGVQAVPQGQREAARALGMDERLVMRRIVFPQALRIVTPAIGNEFIAMIKDSALVSFIGIQELLWRANTVGAREFRRLEALLIAAVVYWILTMAFSFLQERLERHMARGDR